MFIDSAAKMHISLFFFSFVRSTMHPCMMILIPCETMSDRNLLRKLSSSKLGKMVSPRRSAKASYPAVLVDAHTARQRQASDLAGNVRHDVHVEGHARAARA